MHIRILLVLFLLSRSLASLSTNQLRLKGITFAFVAFLFSCQGTDFFDRAGSVLRATRSLRSHRSSAVLLRLPFAFRPHCVGMIYNLSQPLVISTAYCVSAAPVSRSASRVGTAANRAASALISAPRPARFLFKEPAGSAAAFHERGSEITFCDSEHSGTALVAQGSWPLGPHARSARTEDNQRARTTFPRAAATSPSGATRSSTPETRRSRTGPAKRGHRSSRASPRRNARPV